MRVGPHLTGWCGMGLLVLATPKSCALTMFSLVPFWSPAGLSCMQPLPSPDAWGHPQPLCPCSKPREGLEWGHNHPVLPTGEGAACAQAPGWWRFRLAELVM